VILPALLFALSAQAEVTVDVDRETLNRILAAVVVDEIEVELSTGNTITVELRDLRVTGLEPGNGVDRKDAILTRVTVVAPELGLTVPLQPRVALEVVREGPARLLELRLDHLGLAVPLVGTIDLASLVPPARYPAENGWLLAGTRGDVPITSRLESIEMGRDKLRFRFEIDVLEPTAE
jgi:hypothetical protein